MPRISYLDFSADDPDRAVNFYSNVFGWQINKWDGPKEYWEIKTGESNEPGIDGGLSKREKIGEWTTPFINIPSIDQYIGKIESNGGKIIEPKTAIPGIGYTLLFKDTESNTIGLFEENKEAK
ncbi:MAG TPA: VOC family protein [Nitrososphaeraceae archaeon]|jgi:predicted enzyme related to lactoylglutathione lyase